jgi:hypothetical protein
MTANQSTDQEMPAETLEALRGSIAKWEAIVEGHGLEHGPDDCPLCQLFHFSYRKDGQRTCVGCPVMHRTGNSLCAGSPYDDYSAAEEEDEDDSEARMTWAAKAELDFLKSLLPREAVSALNDLKNGEQR